MDKSPPGNRLQVATVSPEGLPSVRSVYLRGLSEDGTVWFFTDARSEKVGELEATSTSRLFRFVDDVVVRVRSDGAGSRVDVRSKSRDGKGDFGVNAERIRAFRARLNAG